MSEYWISQGRKMCTYCKCWTADNKASINFHEQGKNHKENVQKKLDELRKKGFDDQIKRNEEADSLAAIEKAALASLKSDLAADPSLASAYGIDEGKVHAVKKKLDTLDAVTKDGSSCNKSSASNKSEPSTEDPDPVSKCVHITGDWFSAVNESGYTYYWNQTTNETSWDNPLAPVIRSHGAKSSQSSYGQWEEIQSVEPQSLPDLQLPHDSSNYKVEAEEIPLPSASSDQANDEPSEKKFKEKVVTLATSSKPSEQTGFKKRKIANRGIRKQQEDN